MKKLRKKWEIIITAVVIFTGGFYGYYTYHKVIIKNVFEEMYNSYFNVLSLRAIDNMGQLKPIHRDDQGFDVKNFTIKNKLMEVI